MKRSVAARVVFPMALALIRIVACASPQPARPAPPPDSTLVSLTQWFKLDPVQQEKTRELLSQLYDRTAQIRQKWERQARVHPKELLDSRGIFERDFVAILTEDQKKSYAQEKMRLQLKGKRPPNTRS